MNKIFIIIIAVHECLLMSHNYQQSPLHFSTFNNSRSRTWCFQKLNFIPRNPTQPWSLDRCFITWVLCCGVVNLLLHHSTWAVVGTSRNLTSIQNCYFIQHWMVLFFGCDTRNCFKSVVFLLLFDDFLWRINYAFGFHSRCFEVFGL